MVVCSMWTPPCLGLRKGRFTNGTMMPHWQEESIPSNGADAPDRLVRSCHRGARLICNVSQTKTNPVETSNEASTLRDHQEDVVHCAQPTGSGAVVRSGPCRAAFCTCCVESRRGSWRAWSRLPPDAPRL